MVTGLSPNIPTTTLLSTVSDTGQHYHYIFYATFINLLITITIVPIVIVIIIVIERITNCDEIAYERNKTVCDKI